MKWLILLIFSMDLISSCKRAAPADNPALPAQTLRNIPYGSDSLQNMDVFLPANRSPATTRSFILIHGGGWTQGSKADFSIYLDSFRTRFPEDALFILNYRLVGNPLFFPVPENDIKAAVDFIAAKAEGYQVNPEAFTLLGFSAGAHLALLQAYKNPAPRIRAVVDFFGPSDLVTMYQKPWHALVPLALKMVTGTTPDANLPLYQQSSPITYVSLKSPPTLIFHGSNDAVVHVSQSKLLAQKLNDSGVRHALYVIPGEGHGRWQAPTMARSFDAIQAFLNSIEPRQSSR